MRQLVNYAYASLAEGRDSAQLAELDAALAPPDLKEEMVARQNRIAMQRLAAQAGMGPLVPPKARTRA